jgi:SAM-dependent methyltransferase
VGVSVPRGDPRRTARTAADADADAASARDRAAVVWHDLECGSYTADLPLWRELSAGAPAAGPVLEIGAGTGRVALALAAEGREVVALDRDARLLCALRERAGAMAVACVCADARAFALQRDDFALIVAPMQTVQLLGGTAGRLAFLRRARAHLAPAGVLACAIVTAVQPFDCAAGDTGPSAESARVDGVTYVSRAVRVRVGARTMRIERERSVLADAPSVAPARAARVSPAPQSGRRASERKRERDVVELDRVSVAQLQREGARAGLSARGARAIPATDEHAGGVAVMLGA